MIDGKNKKIIDCKFGDVTGNGANDEVYIISYRFSKCLIKYLLIIKEGNSDRILKYELEDDSYSFEIYLEYFKSLDKLDIFIRSINDCFEGCVKGQIITYEENELKEIFSTNDFYRENNKVSAFYRDYYKVEVINHERNKNYIFDIRGNFKYYLDFVYYKDGKVKEGREKANISSIWGCNLYYPMGSKIANISIVQKVLGQCSTDDICLIESKLSFINNSFNIIDQVVVLSGTSINNGDREVNNKKDFLIGEKNRYEDLNKERIEDISFYKGPRYFYCLAKIHLSKMDLIEALRLLNMNLTFKNPYPSTEEALRLKNSIEHTLRLN